MAAIIEFILNYFPPKKGKSLFLLPVLPAFAKASAGMHSCLAQLVRASDC
jgi:hypothetical protein